MPVPRTSNTYELPNTFVSLSRNLDAELYVRSVHAYDAYLSGRADIRYDFKSNRVVYLVKHEGKVVDAVGRSLMEKERSGIGMEVVDILFYAEQVVPALLWKIVLLLVLFRIFQRE